MSLSKNKIIEKNNKKRSKIEDRTYICEKCGKEVEAKYPSLKKRFCSFKCSNQWKWDNLRKKGYYVPCSECGKLHWRPLRYIENKVEIKEGLFCSQKCFYKSRKGKSINWLEKFPKGHTPWNKGKSMPLEFKEKCTARAIKQWKDQDFINKQMSRDFSYLPISGKEALQKWRKENPEAYYIYLRKAGAIIHKKYLIKLGVLNEN